MSAAATGTLLDGIRRGVSIRLQRKSDRSRLAATEHEPHSDRNCDEASQPDHEAEGGTDPLTQEGLGKNPREKDRKEHYPVAILHASIIPRSKDDGPRSRGG